MPNPDDWWRHNSPAAPHDRPHDAQIPGMPSPSNSSSGPEFTSTGTGQPGSGSGCCALGCSTLMFGAPIFGCLYPLASGTALAAGFAANRLVLSAGSASDTALVVSLVVAIVVFWPMCRLDQRLAMSVPPYRWARHVARIFIIGFLITVNVMGGSGVNFLPHSMLEVQLMIANSRYLIVMAVSVVIAHLFLTKMNFVRTFWGNWLEVLKLRAG